MLEPSNQKACNKIEGIEFLDFFLRRAAQLKEKVGLLSDTNLCNSRIVALEAAGRLLACEYIENCYKHYFRGGIR